MKRANSFILFVVLILLSCTGQLFALIKPPPEKAILPNGLRIVVARDTSLPLVAVALLLDVGSDSSFPVSPGMSGILSQLMYRSDLNGYSRKKLNSALETAGCQIDIDDSKNSIGLTLGCWGPSESLDSMLSYVKASGFELSPSLTDFENARSAVRRHFKDAKTSPLASGFLLKEARGLLFPSTQFAMHGDASEETLTSITLDQVSTLIQQRFVPNNAIIVITGNVDISETIKKSMEFFGSLKAAPFGEAFESKKVNNTSEWLREKREFSDIKKTQVLLAFEAPSGLNAGKDEFAATLLWNGILSRDSEKGANSIFPQELHKDFRIKTFYTPNIQHGIFGIGLEGVDLDVDRTVSTLLSKLSGLAARKITLEELKRAMISKRSEIDMVKESRVSYAYELAYTELVLSVNRVEEFESALERITPEIMRKTAGKLFESGKYALVVVQPLEKQKSGSQDVKFAKLPNGLSYLVKPYQGSEFAAISLFLDLSRGLNLKNGAALSDLTKASIRSLIDYGADSGELKNKLDEVGGNVSIRGNPSGIIITVHGQKEKLSDICSIAKKVLFEAPLSEAILDSAKKGVSRDFCDAEEPIKLLWDCFSSNVFASSPLRFTSVSEAETHGINLSDLQEFCRTVIVPANVSAAIVGNIDTQKMEKEIESTFGQLPKASPLPPVVIPPELKEPLPKPLEIDLPGKGRGGAYLALGFRFPPLDVKDASLSMKRFALGALWTHILTWSKNGIIFKPLEEAGLIEETCFIQFSTNMGITSVFTVFRVPEKRALEAKEKLKDILRKLPELSITEQQLQTAAKIWEALFLGQMERSDSQSNTLAGLLGSGYWEAGILQDFGKAGFHNLFKDVKVEDAQKFASDFLKNYFLALATPEEVK
ncbi:MAG: insulinase family protein [Candidatus Riflebacteria bacterium]|nr:insulinase family protein [Candidatus Riflebacteria bacterium]